MSAFAPRCFAIALLGALLVTGCHSRDEGAKEQGAELMRQRVTAPIDKAKDAAAKQEEHKQEADALSGQ